MTHKRVYTEKVYNEGHPTFMRNRFEEIALVLAVG